MDIEIILCTFNILVGCPFEAIFHWTCVDSYGWERPLVLEIIWTSWASPEFVLEDIYG